jgi:hypothetical protein
LYMNHSQWYSDTNQRTLYNVFTKQYVIIEGRWYTVYQKKKKHIMFVAMCVSSTTRCCLNIIINYYNTS